MIQDAVADGAFWSSKTLRPISTPSTLTQFCFHAANKYFPVVKKFLGEPDTVTTTLHETLVTEDLSVGDTVSDTKVNKTDFLDTGNKPYGFLTNKGAAEQMAMGSSVRDHYMDDGAGTSSFFDKFDISVYSTDYLRTTLSAQAVLLGLLPDASPPSPSLKVPVHVRPASLCTLNAYDRDPALMKSYVKEVVGTEAFQATDNKASDQMRPLLEPHLVLADRINWVTLTDHFVCRSSHNTQYFDLAPVDDAAEPSAEQAVGASLHEEVHKHLCWRFKKWYGNKRLLASIAAPMLSEVMSGIDECDSVAGVTVAGDTKGVTNKKTQFTIFSCHDVTLLGLIYSIRASKAFAYSFWPAYSSYLSFELLEVTAASGEVSKAMRIKYNGEIIEFENSRVGCVGVEGFRDIVRNLTQHLPDTVKCK
jgi:hypothetical protein